MLEALSPEDAEAISWKLEKGRHSLSIAVGPGGRRTVEACEFVLLMLGYCPEEGHRRRGENEDRHTEAESDGGGRGIRKKR